MGGMRCIALSRFGGLAAVGRWLRLLSVRRGRPVPPLPFAHCRWRPFGMTDRGWDAWPEASYRGFRRCPARQAGAVAYSGRSTILKEISMPLILWLLGVPLGIVLLLMLFGVL
jgi:hypothetical protein